MNTGTQSIECHMHGTRGTLYAMAHFHLFFTLKYIEHHKHHKHLRFWRNLCGRLECLITNADVQLRIMYNGFDVIVQTRVRTVFLL